MRAQLSLELLVYMALAGLSLLVALSSAEKIMQVYHINGLFRFNCISALKNATYLCR